MSSSPGFLALSSAHPPGSVFFKKGEVSFERVAQTEDSSSSFTTLLDECLDFFSPKELTHIILDTGPGSFTATRLAMSIGLGIASARSLPVIPILSTEAYAQIGFQKSSARSLLVVLLLRPDTLFFSGYHRPGSPAFSPSVLSLSDWSLWMESHSSDFDLLCLPPHFPEMDFPIDHLFLSSYTAHNICSAALQGYSDRCCSPEDIRAEYGLFPSALTLDQQKKRKYHG